MDVSSSSSSPYTYTLSLVAEMDNEDIVDHFDARLPKEAKYQIKVVDTLYNFAADPKEERAAKQIHFIVKTSQKAWMATKSFFQGFLGLIDEQKEVNKNLVEQALLLQEKKVTKEMNQELGHAFNLALTIDLYIATNAKTFEMTLSKDSAVMKTFHAGKTFKQIVDFCADAMETIGPLLVAAKAI